MNIVLFEPEIPQNTGNIVRTCAATGSRLHLIEPLGFEISDKQLKRAGLDYWGQCQISVYKNIDDFYEKNAAGDFFYASTKAAKRYDQASYTENAYIIFGPETRGLPDEILKNNYDRAVRIPMCGDTRSLNLSNSAAIILYEALRQHDFCGLNTAGKLRQDKNT